MVSQHNASSRRPLGWHTGIGDRPVPAAATRAAARARGQGGRCRCGGPRGRRGVVPGRGSPAPTPAVRTRSVPHPLLPPRTRCPCSWCSSWASAANRGAIFLCCSGEPFLLFILFLLCSGISMFNNVLLLIRSSSRSLLTNDFCSCFFLLLLDRFSVRVSCALFQLLFSSSISATSPSTLPVSR